MNTARTQRARSGGFTLLEMMFVLGLVGLLMASVVTGIRALSKSELRSSASRLAGAVRYLFDRASTTGKIHRLVIDFDSGRYWAEISDDRYFMPRERETDESRGKDLEQIAEEQKAAKAEATDESALYDV